MFHKMSQCLQVRVDFVDTELLTPENGNCNEQYFIASGTIWPLGLNRICGVNPGKNLNLAFSPLCNLATLKSSNPCNFETLKS